MNKKLISLAVAAALVAPAAAMADAILYGKMNVSLDYIDMDNAIAPVANVLPVSINGVTSPSIWARNGVNLGYVVPGVAGPLGAVAVAPQTVGGGSSFKGWGMANGYVPSSVAYNAAGVTSAGGGRANRLGVKGSEELGGGLKAIYQIEIGINANDTNNNLVSNADTFYYRNTFVGLAGGWGTALMGRHDTPLKISTGKLDLFADTLADMNATVGFQDLRADNVVAYISPSFGGFTLAGAVVPAGGSTALGTTNTESDQINGAWSLAGIYSNGPFYASAAYESLNAEMFNTNANNYGCAAPVLGQTSSCGTSDSDWTKWRFGLGLLDWNGFSLTAIYEHHDNIAGSNAYTTGPAYAPLDSTYPGAAMGYNYFLPASPDQMDLWQIQAGYSFGASQIKAMYGATSFDSGNWVANPIVGGLARAASNDVLTGDRSTWAVGYDYNFSKRTKVYALYTDVQDDRKDWIAGSEWSGFSLGMMHSF